jgi:hypothetical protein
MRQHTARCRGAVVTLPTWCMEYKTSVTIHRRQARRALDQQRCGGAVASCGLGFLASVRRPPLFTPAALALTTAPGQGRLSSTGWMRAWRFSFGWTQLFCIRKGVREKGGGGLDAPHEVTPSPKNVSRPHRPPPPRHPAHTHAAHGWAPSLQPPPIPPPPLPYVGPRRRPPPGRPRRPGHRVRPGHRGRHSARAGGGGSG